MCNCGKQRMQYASQQSSQATSAYASPETIQNAYINFEYTGKTALNVTGNTTGANYRFHRPGDIQSVDHRDARGMIGIGVLRRLI